MVRTYIRKSERAKKYTKENLKTAIEEVKRGAATLYGAARKHGIPKSTLHDHIFGKTGLKSQSLGRAFALQIEQERELADGLKTLERWGFGLSRKEVIDLVSKFVSQNDIKTPFKNNIPGSDWFTSFKKRHNLSIKVPQAVEFSRKKMTDPFVIGDYFKLLKSTLDELELNDLPHRIWNLDETSLSMDPTKTKIVGAKGVACSRVTSGPGKENVTILSTVNASGEKAPPLIIFKGKFVWDQWMAQGDDNFEIVYAASTNGWMEGDIFYNYIKKTFIAAIGPERPVLLIYDGHSTHVDQKIVKLAKENNVTILKLPPHTSHLLQPLDLSVFKSFKTTWDAKLVAWQRQNTGVKLPKQHFSELVRKIWKDLNPEIIKNGFKKAGIYPYDPNVVPQEKYDPAAWKRWQTASNVDNSSIVPNDNINESEQADLLEAGSSNVSFQDLLLETVKQNAQHTPKKKTRVGLGAEVITKQEAVDKIEILKNIKKQKLSKRKKKIVAEGSSDSDNNNEIEPEEVCQDSDDDLVFIGDISSFNKDEDETVIVRDSWILIKYCPKKILKYYVGQVKDKISDHEFAVQCLKYKRSSSQFYWPEQPDEDIISNEQIVRSLPEPLKDRRGSYYTFSVSFAGLNIC